jgi:hypothetical protein
MNISYLLLIHVHPIFSLSLSFAGIRNLARGCGQGMSDPCPTLQSSTDAGYISSIANDGNKIGTFTSTAAGATDPWWRIDLGKPELVESGKIWNRDNCCPERLDGFQIWIGDETTYNGAGNFLCYTDTTSEHNLAPFTHSFTCNGMGRYVFVFVPGPNRYVSLNEVEIYNPGTYPSQGD